ncbi:Cellulose synthase operon protein C [Halioglobus japonicus]|nr:Cellulose synthase operon protein C [Halioglobus japonicus]
MKTLLRTLPVLFFVSCLLLGCGDDMSSEEHLNSADNFIKEGKYQEAIIELKNSLRKDTGNARARATLGTIYFQEALYADADKELSRALSSGMDPTVVVPVLSQVLLNLREYDRLDELSLDGLDAESRSTLLAAQGLSKLYNQESEAAFELVDAAMENEPNSIYAKVVAARVAMVRGNPDEARAQLRQVFEADEEYAQAWTLLGDIERAKGDSKKARQAYSKAINLTKNKFEPLLNRALVRIDMGEFEEAERDLNRLERNYPAAKEHPGVQFAKGLVYIQSKKVAEAVEALEIASQYPDNYPESLYYLAAIEADKGRTNKAMTLISQYLVTRPESADGAKLAAKLELRKKNYRGAERLLLPVVNANEGDQEAMNLLANARLAQGNNDAGIALLAKIVELQPESNEAKARLGAAYLAAGSEELGIETLQGILAEDPQYDNADNLIIMYYLSKQDMDKAIQSAQEYTERNATPKSYVLLARTYIANDQPDQAKDAFAKALELKPGHPIAGNSLAEYALVDSDYETARSYYNQVLEQNPANMDTRMKLASTYAMEGRNEEMLAFLDETLVEYPRSMEPRLVKARYFITTGELEKAIPLFEALSEEQKEHPDALETIATFELETGRFNQAVGTIGTLIEKKQNVANYHFMKSRAYAGLGEKEKMVAELNSTLRLNPNHFGAKIATARIALLDDDIPEFQKKLDELKKKAPDNSEVIRLEIAYAHKEGDNKRAKELLEGLFEREPTTSNVIALATLKQSSGDMDGAISQLEGWVAQNPDDVTARGKLSEIYGREDRVQDVMLQCREILKREPDNIVALNNLAWYLLKDDPKQALSHAERAVSLAPDSSSVLDTLALAQLENGNIVDARRSIDRALADSPKSPDIRFHEARIRAAEGDTTGAIVALNSLLNRDEEFSEKPAAQALLEELKAQ